MAQQNLDIVVRVRGGQVAATEVKGVAGAVQGVGTATEETSKKTSGLGRTLKGLASAAVVYKGFNYIKGAVQETATFTRATAGLTRLTGLSTQSSAGWVALAKERGIQSKQLNQGFITLNKNIVASNNGSKTAAKSFAALGLTSKQLSDATPDKRMAILADSFHNLPPGINKAAMAQKLFGRQAQNLLPILDQGGRALDEQVTKLGKQTGMTKEGAKQALAFVKMQREWEATQMQLKLAIGQALVPVLGELAKALMPLVQAFATAMTHSGAFRFAIIALTAALGTFVAVMFVASASVAWIPAVVAGVGIALVMLYQKCAWFRNAVQVMGRVAKAAFDLIKNAAVGVFNWVKAHWPLLVTLIAGPLGLAVVQAVKHFDTVKGAAKAVWDFLKGLGSFIGGVFAGAWNTAAGAVKAVADAIGTVIDTAKKITSLPGKALKFVTGVVPGLQMGGTVTHAGSVLVGESGPEVVHLPTGSQVIPNHALGGAMYGGGRGRVVVPVYLDTRQIAVAFGDYTADQQAAR